MRIVTLIERRRPFVSFEFYPPKDRAAWPGFLREAARLRAAAPLFVSVTYGAMGSTRDTTLEIVSRLKREIGLETMAHLTCIGASRENLDAFLDALAGDGVDNVLALRGDPPREGGMPDLGAADFRCAADLVSHIRERHREMGVAVAAYPEGHPEAPSPEEDLAFLKGKFDRGADFAITQLFFENESYWRFLDRARRAGIEAPLVPGILPILNLSSAERIVSLCGARVPPAFLAELREARERRGAEEVRRLGVRYATDQARELLRRGAPGVHLYTLNKADACLQIVRALGMGGEEP
ncbi:MAG: methylenetetrahydrofolate reductase [NAD(P)H] [bacterium]|nr:methylenetetrahydrofolate reductase [NAD(P)H] [bacterium]